MTIPNPFTPAVMATEPDSFFGRSSELTTLSRSIQQGSVAIQGPVGIGKSSLLSRTLLHMDGFDSSEDCICITAVGHRDIETVDDAARLILEECVNVDQRQEKITFGIPKLLQAEIADVYQHFVSGRHLAALTRILEDTAFKEALKSKNHLIVSIDEADKCAPAIARLIRTVSTKTQLGGISNIRFVLAGVSPFYSDMIEEDEGISRFIYKTINLGPLDAEVVQNLIDTKFDIVEKESEGSTDETEVDDVVKNRIVNLSGGHPHLVQLLGSHVIEHEILEPDGIIDSKDLVDSLTSICYESRGPVYEALIHRMQEEGKFSTFVTFVELAGGSFPGVISRSESIEERGLDLENVQWLLERNILVVGPNNDYRIVDEFLRLRIVMDLENQKAEALEAQILEEEQFLSIDDFSEGHLFQEYYENVGFD